MDDIFLPRRVACSHCLSSCHGDALSHADELLRCGRLVGSVPGLKHLGRTGRVRVIWCDRETDKKKIKNRSPIHEN